MGDQFRLEFDKLDQSSLGEEAVKISEHPLGAEIARNIRACATDGARLLGIDLAQEPVEQIVEAIDNHIRGLQKIQAPRGSEADELSYSLGSLWGEAIVRDLGWEWAGVTFHDHANSRAVGVLSRERSFAIYPFHFIYGCIANDAPVTILLSYNMLKDGYRMPHARPREFRNVMEHVHHIVPPE